MERRYFFISLPNENVIHALNIRLGENVSNTYNLDGSVIFIKTTADLILNKVNTGISIGVIFPNGLTTELTLEESIVRLRSTEFQNEVNM